MGVDLSSLTAETVSALTGTNAISSLARGFAKQDAALQQAAAARKARDAVVTDATTDMVTLAQEKQRAAMTSAETQARELSTMASALDRTKEINNSFWLKAVEPLATVFNMHDYSRQLLRQDLGTSQRSLKIEESRNALQSSIIEGKASEIDAKVKLADATFISSAGKFADLQTGATLARQSASDIEHAQTINLATADAATLQQKVTAGELSQKEVK